MESRVKNRFRIIIEELSVAYQKGSSMQEVVSDISLIVEPNSVLCILGTNGSGKTTLLSSIAGFLKPTRGSATLMPLEPQVDQPAPIIAFLHQDYRQTNFPWATVLDNVAFPLRFQGIGSRERFERATGVLTEILPDVNPRKRAYELSGGQQQLLAIARALASSPDVLFGDEALSAADSVRRIRAINAIERARSSYTFPMMWISHDIDEALLLGDSIALLSRRTHGFSSIINNPVSRPRVPVDLARPEMAALKASILNFLLSDNSTN